MWCWHKLWMTIVAGLTVSTSVTFVAGPLYGPNSSITASSSSTTADGSSSISLQVKARDAYNNPVTTNVSLAGSGGNNMFGAASGPTDANGNFVTTLTSTQVQSEIITASLGQGINPNINVQFIAGPAAVSTSSFTLSPNTQVADNNSMITATLVLKDAQAHPLSGVTPSFSASGTATNISSATSTDANGIASVIYKTAVAQNENALVSAGGISLTSAASFIAGPPAASASTLAASPNSLVANGTNTTSLTATARDAQGNSVANTSVSLAGSGGNNTFAASSGTTNASGLFTTTLKSTQVQSETITATLNSNVAVTATVTFTTGPASASKSALTITPASQIANNSNTIVATLTLKDAQAHPIAGVTPTFSASGTSTTFSSAAATNAAGQSSVTFQTPQAQNENATVAAGGINLSTAMTFVAGPPSAANSYITLSPNSVVADGNTFIAVSAHLADANNNQVKNFSLGFSTSGGAGPFGDSGLVTNSSGNANVTLLSSVRGTSTISVNGPGLIASATLTGNAPAAYCNGNPNYSSGSYNLSFVGVASAIGDWNNDLSPDWAYVDNTNQLVVYYNTNAFGLAQKANYLVCPLPQAVQAADLNGDGNTDLVVICSGTNAIQTLLGTGSSTFTAASSYTGAAGGYGLVLADFNGDGRVDAAVTNQQTASMLVYPGTGSGSFAASSTYAVGGTPMGVASGDFNGDGLSDLVVANSNDNTVGVLLASATSGFTSMVTYATDALPVAVAVADFDNNNRLDFAVVNRGGNTVGIFLNKGSGAFNAQVSYAAGNSPAALSLNDLNGDGYTDVAISKLGAATTSVYINSGTGSLNTAVSHPSCASASIQTGMFGHVNSLTVSYVQVCAGAGQYVTTLYNTCN